jgi:hypothetical protein
MTGGAAIWHLPDGDYCYAEMSVADLDLDVAPSG